MTEPPQKLGPIPIESITAAAGKGYCSTAKDYKYGAPLRILEAKESASGHTTTKALASVTAARISAEISEGAAINVDASGERKLDVMSAGGVAMD